MGDSSLQKDEADVEGDDDLQDIDVTRLEEQPSLEEFSKPLHEFKVELEESAKSDAYILSQKLNRLFTTTDKSLIFNMQMNPHTPLVARIMFVCSNQIFQPLSRCSQHIRGDNTEFRDHVVTHKDSTARYVGTASGMFFRDRLAILARIEETGHKSIALDFKCLSSCFKIKKITTALIFTLEDEETNKILSRQVFNVHVSKNFKRDAEVAEKNIATIKRPLSVAASSQETLVDLSELKFLLPSAMVHDFLEHIQQFFKAKLYNTNGETDESLTSESLTNSLKTVSFMIEKLNSSKAETKVKKLESLE